MNLRQGGIKDEFGPEDFDIDPLDDEDEDEDS